MKISAADHNAEAQAVWAAFHAGRPIRPPVILGTNTQYFILNDDLNPGEAVTFEAYSTQAQTMLDFQLRIAVWRIEHVAPYCDDPMELPESFSVRVDLQNYDEAAYFGAPVIFLPHQVPDTRPILNGAHKTALFEAGLPDPLTGGWYRQAHRLHAEMHNLITRRPTYLDRPISLEPFGLYTCGPLTIASQLRGAELFFDLYEDPDYVHHLLDFIVEGTIARIHAQRRFFGLPEISPDLFFADDAIELISPEMLNEFMLPAYRKLKAGLTSAERIKIHLCGKATHHFKNLRDQLGAYHFETGFPVDFGQLRRELGPDVTIEGGPNAVLLKEGSPEQIKAETHRILDSGVCDGGRFILREGNNVPPHTPEANMAAMYEAARARAF